jgi:hypothetical protein
VRKSLSRRQFEKQRKGRLIDIKSEFELGCTDSCTNLAQDRVQWRVSVLMVLDRLFLLPVS